MNNILMLIPDQLLKPMGGMGEQARNLLTHFSSHFYFNVIGSSDSHLYHSDNYSFFPVMSIYTFCGDPDPLSHTFLNQSLFVEKAISIQKKPDIIHAFDWSTFWAGRILAKHFNVPLIVTIQLSIDKHIDIIHSLQTLQHNLAISIELSGLFEAAAIVQVSESYANLFPSFFKEKTCVIHNGINADEWVRVNDVILPGNAPIKLIYIGRFAEMKNVHSLIKCKIPDEIDLIFIGDNRGGASQIYDAMIDFCNNTSNAHYVGPKYGQEKIDWLLAADAVIVPSVHEPFGIVALEALASQSILLSSFVNGMGDFLDDSCAINCGTSVDSIENSFQRLINLTESQKTKMIESGLKVCLSHSWFIQACKLEQVYQSVLN